MTTICWGLGSQAICRGFYIQIFKLFPPDRAPPICKKQSVAWIWLWYIICLLKWLFCKKQLAILVLYFTLKSGCSSNVYNDYTGFFFLSDSLVRDYDRRLRICMSRIVISRVENGNTHAGYWLRVQSLPQHLFACRVYILTIYISVPKVRGSQLTPSSDHCELPNWLISYQI